MRQAELSKTVGCSQPYISEILSGKKRPSWQLAKRLAEATETDVAWWMDGEIDRIAPAIGWNEIELDVSTFPPADETLENYARRTLGGASISASEAAAFLELWESKDEIKKEEE